jgi:signal peptidase I, archaeal type
MRLGLSFRDKVALILTLLLIVGYLVFRVSGGGFAAVEGRSMEPLLHTGDLVVLVKRGDIDVGDIVVYSYGSKYVIHRVVGKYEVNGYYCYIVKGDNNVIPDTGDPRRCPPSPYGVSGIPEDSIVGVVLTVRGSPVKIPYIGSITLLVRS